MQPLDFKTISEYASIIGLPPLYAILVWVVRKVRNARKENKEREAIRDMQIKTLMSSQQTQMRRQLLGDYYRFKERGFIYEDELDLWVRAYSDYEQLGENGIMNGRYQEIITMECKRR